MKVGDVRVGLTPDLALGAKYEKRTKDSSLNIGITVSKKDGIKAAFSKWFRF